MKFVCDRCGKKYATAEDPAPGKVYKLKCKACGHLIVVKSQAGTSTAIPALTAAELAGSAPSPTPAPAPAPEIELEIEAPAPASPPVPELVDDAAIISDAPTLPPLPEPELVDESAIITAPPDTALPAEVAAAIDGAAPLPAPPPPEKDELAEFAAEAAAVIAAPVAAAAGASSGSEAPRYVDLFGDGGITGETRAKDDPFAKAEAEKPPPDPFEARPEPPVAPPVAARPATSRGLPAAKKKGSPVPLIVGGAALIAVITIVAVIKGGKPAEPPRPAPTITEPAPPPPPAPVAKAEPPIPARTEPEPAPEPVRAVAPAPAPEPPKPAAVEKRPEPKPEPKPEPPKARVEKKPEPAPAPAPPPKAAAPAPAPPPAPAPEPAAEPRTETREVALPDAEQALTPDVVQKVINANKKAFAGCISSASDSVKLDGRRVVLKLTVNSSGAVTYPTLDDVTLNSTDMGQCLKSAARLMIFPKFKGDPFHVEVPLTLSN